MNKENKGHLPKSGKRLKEIPFKILKDKNNRYILEEFNNSELLYEEFDSKYLLDKIKSYSNKENNFKTFERESLCVDINIALTSIIEGIDSNLRYDHNPKFFIVYINAENIPSAEEMDEIISIIRENCNHDAEIRISIAIPNDKKVIKQDYIKVRFIWIDKNIFQLTSNMREFIDQFPDFDLNINLRKEIKNLQKDKIDISSICPEKNILETPACLLQIELFDTQYKMFYKLEENVIQLQNNLNFSRFRVKEGLIKPYNTIFSDEIQYFLNSTYKGTHICGSFFKFKYPEDYQWLTDDWYILHNNDNILFFGYNYGVSEEEIELNDYKINLINEINNQVEIEIYFNQLLDTLSKIVTDKKGIIDIGISIPFSTKELISSFEIRIVRLLSALGSAPRVNFNIRDPYESPEESYCFFLTYMQFIKNR